MKKSKEDRLLELRYLAINEGLSINQIREYYELIGKPFDSQMLRVSQSSSERL